MSYKEAFDQLDNLIVLAEFAIANLRVVQTALDAKVVDAAEGGYALFTTCEYLRDLRDQMEVIVYQAKKANRQSEMEVIA